MSDSKWKRKHKKCPNCERHSLEIYYKECAICGGDEIYGCNSCGMQYDLEGNEL